MPHALPGATRSVIKVVAGLVVGTLALTGGVSGCDDTPVVTVVKVVDGDTIDVRRDGEEHRVRLLNIDTPESTDPDQEPECLGPEATQFLEDLLPAGAEVTLEFDEELRDPYGRVLAGVFLDDVLVNAEIAREGLGVAVLFEPNDRFYDDVSAAQDEAREAGRGMYDAAAECTVPAQVEQFGDTVDEVLGSAPSEGAALESLEDYAAELAATAALGAGLTEILDGDGTVFPLIAFTGPDLRRMVSSVDAGRSELARTARRNDTAIAAEQDRLAEEAARKAAEEAARKAAEEEAERKAAEEAERKAAEEEAERKAAEEAAAWQAEQEAEARAEAQRQADAEAARRAEQDRQAEEEARRAPQRSSGSSNGSSSSGSSGGYDGYTGCRAYGGGYAPNAVDEQGRPYTKIHCTTKTPIG